jgi:hypothetical protein
MRSGDLKFEIPISFTSGCTVIYVAKNGQTLGAGQPPISFVLLQLATWHLELLFPAISGSSFLSGSGTFQGRVLNLG